MPEITGRLRTPRLAAAPASPVVGEMYYDTLVNKLYWWDGTTWVPAMDAGGSGGGGTVPMEPWHVVGAVGEPAFLNSWVNYGAAGTEVQAGFRKDPLGHVILRGIIKTGSANQPAFLLPVGYRPPAGGSLRFSVPGPTQIDVRSDGYVNIGSYALGWVDLAGVEFDTETVTAMPTGPKGDKGDKGDAGGTAPVPIDPWVIVNAKGAAEPAFQGNWVNTGGTLATAAFRKDPLGRVLLRGGVKGDSAGVTIFTLPVGYRPPADLRISMPTNNGNTPSTVVIPANGNVAVHAVGTAGTTTYLDGVLFDTETVTTMPTGPTGATGPMGPAWAPAEPNARTLSLASTFSAGGWNAVTFSGGTTSGDAAAYAVTSSQIVVRDAGNYTISAMHSAPASTNRMLLQLLVNGGQIWAQDSGQTGNSGTGIGPTIPIAVTLNLAAGSTIQLSTLGNLAGSGTGLFTIVRNVQGQPGPAGPAGPATGWVAMPFTGSGYAVDRSFNAGATTLNEIANVLATLIADMKSGGLMNTTPP